MPFLIHILPIPDRDIPATFRKAENKRIIAWVKASEQVGAELVSLRFEDACLGGIVMLWHEGLVGSVPGRQ